MFFFDRTRVERPKWFDSKIVRSELMQVGKFLSLSAEERSQTTIPTVWKTPVPPEVEKALMFASGHRCAFCEERRVDLKSYRFRPPVDVQPSGNREDRECYIWHAFDWHNFFPICDDCVDKAKQNYFPVSGKRNHVYFRITESEEVGHFRENTSLFVTAHDQRKAKLEFMDLSANGNSLWSIANLEEAKLYAPGSISAPSRYFGVKMSGELEAIYKYAEHSDDIEDMSRAELTIHHFNLNSPKKVKARGDRLTHFCDALLEYSRSSEWNADISGLFEFHDLEFASAWYLLLRRLGLKLAQNAGLKPSLSMKGIEKTFHHLFKAGALLELDDCRTELVHEDARLTDTRISDIISRDYVATIAQAPQSGPLERTTFPEAISEISIRNYKALEHINLAMMNGTDADHEQKTDDEAMHETSIIKSDKYGSQTPSVPALLILGENATGKSSILEAITLTLVDDDAFGELDLDAKRMVLNPEYMGSSTEQDAAPPVSSEVKIILRDGSRYEFKVNGKSGTFNRRHHAGKAKFEKGVPHESAVLIFAYGAHRLFGKSSSSRTHSSNVVTLFENDALTINPEQWMVELYQRDRYALDDIVAALREIIQIDGRFETIGVEDDPLNDGEKHCVIKLKRTGLVEKGGEKPADEYTVPIRLDSVSSGYRVLIALVCDIIHGLMEATGTDSVQRAKDMPCVVLIDEIEAHLHPRWKMQVIGGLRKALPKATFIMTSHDPLCLRGMLPGEVQVLNRFYNTGQGEGSKMNEIVENVAGMQNAEQFTVEQLLTSDLFQLFTTDDRHIDQAFAELGDAISPAGSDGEPIENPALEKIRENIRDALPVGDNEVVRLVQEVVVQYLANRRSLRDETARSNAKKEILAILNGRPT